MRSRVAWSCWVLCVLLVPGVAGQEVPATGPAAAPDIAAKIAETQTRIQTLEGIAAPEPYQQQALTNCRNALESLQLAERAQATARNYQQNLATLEDDRARLQAESRQTPTSQPIDPALPLPQLETERARLATELAAAQAEYEQAAGLVKQRPTFLADAPRQIAEAQKQLTELPADVTPADESESAQTLARSETRLLNARRTLLEQQVAANQAQLKYFEAAGDFLTLRRDAATRRVQRLDEQITAIRDAIFARQEAEAVQARQEAEAARRDAIAQSPALRPIADENQKLATERAELVDKLRVTTALRQGVDKRYEELDSDFKAVRASVEAAQFSNAVGALLRTKHSKLPNPVRYRRSRAERSPEIDTVMFRALALGERSAEMVDLRPLLVPFDDEEVIARARELLEVQKTSIDALQELYDKYVGELSQLDEREGALVALIEEYARFIDEQILWTQSSRGLTWQDIQGAPEAAAWLIDPTGWAPIRRAPDPLPSAIAIAWLLLVIALLLLRRRIRRVLTEIGQRAARPTNVSIVDTFLAIALTTLLAAPVPLLLFGLAWYIGRSAGDSELAASLSAGAVSAGWVAAVLLWVYHGLVKNGLARAHFNTNDKTAIRLRGALFWLVWPAVPLVLVLVALEVQDDDFRKDTLGRVLYALAVLVWLVFAHRVFGPKGGLSESDRIRATLWFARLRWLWYALAIGTPLGLLGASLSGYQYTAMQLADRLALTFAAVLLALLVDSIAQRWLLLTRRKLAIEQARQRRAARQTDGETAEPPAELQIEVNLPALSMQTRQLLYTAIVLGLGLLAYAIWAPVLPALTLFDRIQVPVLGVSLGALGLAIFASVLTLLAVKNLPGLLEIAVLQHIPMDQSARHAATALARYAILMVGVSAAFGALGVGWNNVQWLVAAVSVGLGFGLQEIFANFVSGLILMFERPIRLGDVVTVGGITGTVTRINTRATTIIDWDRKELVIPNREFVTGQIVNWSLTDQVLRLVIPIGVAYGSDTELTRRTLLQMGEQCKRALADPKPRVHFISFGDSALLFELRCYVANLDDWLLGRDELNMAIDAAFREAGIEISFPQRDLHVRSVDERILEVLRAQQNPPAAPEPADTGDES